MKKIILVSVISIIILFVIKSRIVPQEHFEIMTLDEFNEVYAICNKIKEAEINETKYKLNQDEEYYFRIYGSDVCNHKDSLRYKIEKKLEVL
jgi:hypothetical protein